MVHMARPQKRAIFLLLERKPLKKDRKPLTKPNKKDREPLNKDRKPLNHPEKRIGSLKQKIDSKQSLLRFPQKGQGASWDEKTSWALAVQ